MFKKILVAFDGSEDSFKALKKAIALAKMHECEISLATVVNLPELPKGEYIEKDHLCGKRTPFQRDLEKAAIMVMQKDVPVTTHLLRGQSARSLVTYCEKNNYDLVVTGARGKNPQKEADLGSFSSLLANSLSGKVMVVKGNEEDSVKTA